MDTTQDLLDIAKLFVTQAVDETNIEDYPSTEQKTALAQAIALVAIAQELKRANDDRDAELAYQERWAERQRMLDDC